MGAAGCRVLAIMGSGETSPTMVEVHKALLARLGPGRHAAALLDSPYAFQENADDISARARSYFARSVGLDVDVITEATLPHGPHWEGFAAPASPAVPAAAPASPAGTSPAGTSTVQAIRSADWLFAGPGSPSYALARWRDGPVASVLRERVAAGAGVTVLASAAAATMGLRAIPVYEVYKTGADPRWLVGLDLLSVLGLRVTVIPHYDNAEGGTHDTRFCYLGERRLTQLEATLPPGTAVLGVDEHTALVADLAAQAVLVAGRGGVTVRRAGVSTVLPAGTELSLAGLRDLTEGTTTASPADPPAARPAAARPTAARLAANGPAGPASALTLPEATELAQRQFDAAAGAADGPGMAAAILDLDEAISAWASDTDENADADRARAVLRALVARLGRAAAHGLADPADRLAPAITPLLGLRSSLRDDGGYAAADAIRDALAQAGIEVRDTPGGTAWSVLPRAEKSP